MGGGGLIIPTAKNVLERVQACGVSFAVPPGSPGMEDQPKIPSWLTLNAPREIFQIFHSVLGFAEPVPGVLALDKNHPCSCFGNSISWVPPFSQF